MVDQYGVRELGILYGSISVTRRPAPTPYVRTPHPHIITTPLLNSYDYEDEQGGPHSFLIPTSVLSHLPPPNSLTAFTSFTFAILCLLPYPTHSLRSRPTLFILPYSIYVQTRIHIILIINGLMVKYL